MATTAALGFTLAATHRVIDRVHDHAAHVRTPALPAGASGLAARHVHVIDVADLADRREAGLVDPANFAGRQFHQRVTGFAVAQRRLLPGAARNLAAAARGDLNVMNVRSQRNRLSGKRIAEIRARPSCPDITRRATSSIRPARGCSSSRRPCI